MSTSGATQFHPLCPTPSVLTSTHSSHHVPPVSTLITSSATSASRQSTESSASCGTGSSPAPGYLPPKALSGLHEAGVSEEQWELILKDAEAHAHHIICSALTTLPSPPSTPALPTESQGQQRRIPRPRNSWMVFRQCVNRSEHLPDALRRCQKWLSAVTGPCWTALPEARKQIFEEAGKAEAEAHQRAYPGYKYQPTRKAKKQGPLKNIDTEVRAGELAREPYERSAAAAGSSLSGRKGTGTATASESGVAAKHPWYPDVLDVPLPQPQQAFTRTSTAVPPTLPSIRFPALSLVHHRSPIGTQSSVSSIASSWGWTTPDYPVPRAHEDWWPARTTVPLAPTPVPASLQQMPIGYGHPPEYFDWNYFSSS